jgi:hypothetical protein
MFRAISPFVHIFIKWCLIKQGQFVFIWLENTEVHDNVESSRVSSACLWVYSPLLDLGRFFNFLILYRVSRTPWIGDQPVARPIPTHRTTQTQNKRTHTSLLRVGFQSTIPAFERAKTSSCLRPRGHCFDRSKLCSYLRSISQFIHISSWNGASFRTGETSSGGDHGSLQPANILPILLHIFSIWEAGWNQKMAEHL